MTTDGKITLKVATPAGVYEGTFEVTSKVHEVVDIVVKEKGLQKGARLSWPSMATRSPMTARSEVSTLRTGRSWT